MAAVWDKWVVLHNLQSGKETSKLELPDEQGLFVGFSADGQNLVTASRTVTHFNESLEFIYLWNIPNGKMICKLHKGTDIARAALAPDGRLMAYGSYSHKSIRIVDLVTGRKMFQLGGHSAFVEMLSFSADGRTVVSSAYYEPTSFLWDLETERERCRYSFSEPYSTIFVSPSGSVCATSASSTVRIGVGDFGNY